VRGGGGVPVIIGFLGLVFVAFPLFVMLLAVV
jgi:hypothetical protein